MNPIDAFDSAQQWLFEAVVQPLMYTFGLAGIFEQGYRATGWLLVGLLQIAVMLTLFRALERWRPVEPVTDRAAGSRRPRVWSRLTRGLTETTHTEKCQWRR